MANSASIDIWAQAAQVVAYLEPRIGTGPVATNRMGAVVMPIRDGALVIDDVPEDGNAVVLVESLDRSDLLATQIYTLLAEGTSWRLALYDEGGDAVRERQIRAA